MVVTLSISSVGLLILNSLLVLRGASARNVARNLRQYETDSGSIYLTLPAQDGFTLDYETKSGAFRSALTEREGTLIACGDHKTHYTVPALEGGEMSELEISTVSGTLTIKASPGGN